MNKFSPFLKRIKSPEDYHMATIRLEYLKDAKENTKEFNEKEVLEILIEHYERENAPMGMPDPMDSIKIYNKFFTDLDQKEED